MPTLIDRNGRRPDVWIRASAASDAAADAGNRPAREDAGHRLVAAKDWLAHRDAWLALAGEAGVALGIELDPDDDPAAVAADLPRLSLVAIRFPRFTDGRGFSIARELRQRHRWQGELRATGDILRDPLFYLARCGFDSFDLRGDQDVDRAIEAFGDFTEAYQAAFDRGPLFDRRRSVPASGV